MATHKSRKQDAYKRMQPIIKSSKDEPLSFQGNCV